MTTPTPIVCISVLGHRTEVLLEIDRNEVWLGLETYDGTLLSVPLDDAQLSRLGQAVEAARQLQRLARKPAQGSAAPAGGAADPPAMPGALEPADVAPSPSAAPPAAKHGKLCECDQCIHGGPTSSADHFAAKDRAVLDATRDAHIRFVEDGRAVMTADSADNVVHAELVRRGMWTHGNG